MTFFSYIFILIKAIVWPKPVDHPYIIKLETVVDGCVFCFPFYPLIFFMFSFDVSFDICANQRLYFQIIIFGAPWPAFLCLVGYIMRRPSHFRHIVGAQKSLHDVLLSIKNLR